MFAPKIHEDTVSLFKKKFAPKILEDTVSLFIKDRKGRKTKRQKDR